MGIVIPCIKKSFGWAWPLIEKKTAIGLSSSETNSRPMVLGVSQGVFKLASDSVGQSPPLMLQKAAGHQNAEGWTLL